MGYSNPLRIHREMGIPLSRRYPKWAMIIPTIIDCFAPSEFSFVSRSVSKDIYSLQIKNSKPF